MDLKTSYTGRGLLRGMVLLGCCFPLAILASDPYMDALNAEADSVVVDPETEKQKPSPLEQVPAQGGWSTQDQSMSLDLPPDLDRDDFEESLKLNFYGSYMFYNRLDDSAQEEVYQLYRQNPSIEPVRKRIMQLKKNI
jgi:hypothetical protein